MSDTPRTDAEVKAYNCARIDFARELERENAQLRALLGASLQDTERLDWLESQAGGGWVARHSTRGRGFRLHQDPANDPLTTARQAIDAAREPVANP